MIGLLLIMALPTTIPSGEEPLVDVAPLHPRFRLDIRYATADNFAKVKAYPVARCVLRKSVAEMAVRAQRWLDERHPRYALLFKDCYRPDRVQRVLFEAVRGTKMQGYVANPNTKTGSIHSYGAAIDLTLHEDGVEVDMGTIYDFLGKLAEPRHEERFVAEGKLTRQQVENRLVLRRAMTEGGGFVTIPNEWWHFNAAPAPAIRKRFSRLDVPLESIP